MARILIVEDNDILNTAYELVLTHHGHTVAAAYDGNEGLERAETFNPELILLDMLMPNLNGIGFLKAYDAFHKHTTVKIVLLTNLSEAGTIKQALLLGADEYFLKSKIGPGELVRMINKQLTGKAE